MVKLGATPNQAIFDRESGFTRLEDCRTATKPLQEDIKIMRAVVKKI